MKFRLGLKYYCAPGMLLGAAALLSACGQSGDLYLPEAQQPPQPPAQPARSAEDKPQDKDLQQTGD